MLDRTFYILRHVETGLIMPLFQNNRGYSWWEPHEEAKNLQDAPRVHDHLVPRLFHSRNGAVQSRSKWAQGTHKQKYEYDNWNPLYSGNVVTEPAWPRLIDDLEILSVRIEATPEEDAS